MKFDGLRKCVQMLLKSHLSEYRYKFDLGLLIQIEGFYLIKKPSKIP